MKYGIIDKERKRKIIEQKRKQKRIRLIKRNLTLIGGGMCILFLLIQIALSIRGGQEAKSVAYTSQQTVINQEGSIQSNEDNEVIPKTQEELEDGDLILVNDYHPIRTYSDEQMVIIGDYLQGICQMKSKEIKLEKQAAQALKEMLIDFKSQVGESDLTVISGYRDFDTQEELHYNSLETEKQTGEVFVARPDRSEHHTGLAIDFGLCYKNGTSAEYDGTGIYSWINKNCYKYGFIMRYDAKKKEKTGIGYEPWHFRYVGRVHAQIMNELNLCLEEYIAFIKGYTYYTHPGQGLTQSTQDYSIYYVPCEGKVTNIPLPISKDYTISGNNEDGFIVTVSLINKKYGN